MSDNTAFDPMGATTLGLAPPEATIAPLPQSAPVRVRARPARLRVLMLAATYALPYRVLRCVRELDAEVHVLGNLGAQVLALSRHCTQFHLSQTIIAGHYDEDLALEINCLARQLGVDVILPGDAPSTRALIACRRVVDFPCFPLPGLESFDLLNDKWGFAQLCGELGIRHPATRLYADREALLADIAAGRLTYPLVAKARSLSASRGQVILRADNAAAAVRGINYRPIVVQEFIRGRDAVASIYCRDGAITAFVAHHNHRRVYSTFRGDEVFDDLSRIAARVGAEGVYNFDMIAEADGRIHYLECNPRFFYTIDLAMLAGVNFVALGIGNANGGRPLRPGDGTMVRRPEAVLISPRSWPRLTLRDWAAARYAFTDPVPYALDLLGWPT